MAMRVTMLTPTLRAAPDNKPRRARAALQDTTQELPPRVHQLLPDTPSLSKSVLSFRRSLSSPTPCSTSCLTQCLAGKLSYRHRLSSYEPDKRSDELNANKHFLYCTASKATLLHGIWRALILLASCLFGYSRA